MRPFQATPVMPTASQFEDDDNELVRYARAAARLDTMEAARTRRERRKSLAPQRRADKLRVRQLAEEARNPTVVSTRARSPRTRSISPLSHQIASPQDRPPQKRRKFTNTRRPSRWTEFAFPGRLQVPEPEESAGSISNVGSNGGFGSISNAGSSSQVGSISNIGGGSDSPIERRDTVMSIFDARSWSIWPQKGEESESARDAEAAWVLSGARLTFFERVRKDRVMHFLLALVFAVGLTLIVGGVIYESTHGDIPAEERRRSL